MAEAGIGVDIVEISRMKTILEKTPKKSVHIAMPHRVPQRTTQVVLLLVKRFSRLSERALVRVSAARTSR